MIEIPKYRSPISLIPGGCPQILDYEGPATLLDDIKYAFDETSVQGKDSKAEVLLHVYRKNEEKEFADEMDPARIYQGDGYELNGAREILPWLGQWLPLPFLRMREQTWPDSDDCRFEYGPTNWARGRLSQNPANPGQLRLVLAFDMQVEKKADGIYAALCPEDVDANAHFRLAWRFRDNAWFLDLPWVEEWLREIWEAWRKKNRRRNGDEDPRFAHLASYLVFLEILQRLDKNCQVYVVRPDSGPCVNVDLVLDIGNSRTTGILVETQTQAATNLNDSYLLQLRDMSQPEQIYTDPFETRVEFCEITFGNDALSLRSGRRTAAFAWPSPTRIGPEAARLATLSRSGKGSTGMSSPKRYLWDERDWKRSWRFNTQSEKSPYVTRGPLAQQVNSSGTPICCMDEKEFKNNPILRAQERESAFESYFTRSSLMMFLLVEIIQQALLTINSPGQRQRRDQPDKPRRLRQIIFTVPAGMPKAEQKIYKRWANWAVRVLWEALGWSSHYVSNRKKLARGDQCDYRSSPVVRCDWDEATCTQLVYIYNEITRQFQGDARLFCEMAGRERNFGGHTAPSCRVAAIDIGGGTTDLSITTFELTSGAGSTPRMVPHPEFHDGFNLAGDDILRAVIREQVLEPVGDALVAAGIAAKENSLKALFGRDTMDSSKDTLNQRVQFIRQIAVPAGLCLLELYEKADLRKGSARISFKLGDCFQNVRQGGEGDTAIFPRNGLFPAPSQAAVDYLRNFAAENGSSDDFNVLDVELTMDGKRMDETVRGALAAILANLCEVVNLYDCDALLLTGRPSRWPGVIDAIYSLAPLPPGQVFPMGEYRVGGWYPFSDALGNMTDPKTTVVVGAILCALAEGQLEGFSFDPRNLGLMSTARYIGEMEINGQIKRDKVWFEVEPEKRIVRPAQAEIDFSSPMAVGFRQLEAERWTTSRFYYLDFASERSREELAHNLPLKVKLSLLLDEDEDEQDSEATRDEGEFVIDEVRGADGDGPFDKALVMRLQTLPRNDGFWMDTGLVYEG